MTEADGIQLLITLAKMILRDDQYGGDADIGSDIVQYAEQALIEFNDGEGMP
jgi:hypothetical protein